ncbi:MAG: DUF3955 domain-containing protein [Firmicutes bacterium]|nr:DUF3955 domain-containing protein [Bacillota bacterium]
MIKILTWISFIIVAICGITYQIIGQEIAPDGTLIEPFFLIPIAWLFLFIGIFCIVVRYVRSKIKKS